VIDTHEKRVHAQERPLGMCGQTGHGCWGAAGWRWGIRVRWGVGVMRLLVEASGSVYIVGIHELVVEFGLLCTILVVLLLLYGKVPPSDAGSLGETVPVAIGGGTGERG
jgi:hypothetical protein